MEQFNSADELSDDWDSLCGDNYALKKEFLSLLERANSCSQKYYLFRDTNGKADSIVITFVMKKFNIGFFTRSKYITDVTFVYIPASVTKSGIVMGEKTKYEVTEFLSGIKGYKIIANMCEAFKIDNFVRGVTCPKMLLSVKWSTFNQYIDSMRSSYRYRYKKAMKKMEGIELKKLENNRDFNEEFYSLYEQVYNNSSLKIEKLSIEFFHSDVFKIFYYEKEGKILGFIQLIENGRELIFEFVGFDYSLNSQYDTYINMLLKIVDYGIKNRFELIDFGQTADDAKLKLGCKYEFLYFFIAHSNKFIQWILSKTIKLLQYKPLEEKFNVFKN